jgi:hypothetical protein
MAVKGKALTPEEARRVQRAVEAFERVPRRTLPPLRKRRHIQGRGGGGIQIVMFEIKDVACSSPYLSVEAYVSEVICGSPKLRDDQYFDKYQGTIWIIDALRCFFDEPREALIGRTGYAIAARSLENPDSRGCGWWPLALCCQYECEQGV